MVGHTADLVAALSRQDGVRADLVGWRRMYPAALYHGDVAGPGDQPDSPVPPGTRLLLRWFDPTSWWRTGRRLADEGDDLLVLVLVVPFHALALVVLARAFRRRSAALGRAAVHVTLIAHNVLPHEPHPGAVRLVRWLLRRVDTVLVHSQDQAELARRLAPTDVVVSDLPVHLPGGFPETSVRHDGADGAVRLLFFGLVRHYKGVDLLLEALRQVPGVRLTVAGQLWGDAGRDVERLAASPELVDRVVVRPGYVEPGDVADLMSSHEVMVLPYRDATASFNVELANAYGMPVVASRVGTFPAKVRDGVDGLLVGAGSVPDLVAALQRLVRRDELARLTAQVVRPSLAEVWTPYTDRLLQPVQRG